MTDDDAPPWAIVAGGGTAGHVIPGLAIARALVERDHPMSTIHYVGSARGMERELVPEAGFPLVLLPGRGIQRRFTLENLTAVVGLVRAATTTFGLVARRRPKVVVALGGYASVPVALAAAAWRVPIVVAEQNAVPGAANRLVARFAKAAAVSFPGTALPRAVVTGNPVRDEVLAVDRDRDRARARSELGIEPGRRVVLVFGGSLGALRLNQAAVDAVGRWSGRADLAVRHVVGDRDWAIVEATRPTIADGGIQYQPVRYEHELPRAMAAADLAVCRSGASTCFELAAVGLPAVLVPSPNVTGDHQTANARQLEAAGAAVVIADAELDGRRLAAEVDALLSDAARLERLATALRAFARRDAAQRVADLVEEHARA
ncbi:MAG: undecaprenyldiphospho-muramoylpentapeptide beta-N-acetylglucosaminyltransferase [Acidimicrobiales bacterium]